MIDRIRIVTDNSPIFTAIILGSEPYKIDYEKVSRGTINLINYEEL